MLQNRSFLLRKRPDPIPTSFQALLHPIQVSHTDFSPHRANWQCRQVYACCHALPKMKPASLWSAPTTVQQPYRLQFITKHILSQTQ